MPSNTYQLFERSMATRRPIACRYQGHPRAICPVILGHSGGTAKALVWQFAGSSSSGAVGGQWKCLRLSEVDKAEIVEGPWRNGNAQSCVKEVDLDVNQDSPYAPRRRLPALRVIK